MIGCAGKLGSVTSMALTPMLVKFSFEGTFWLAVLINAASLIAVFKLNKIDNDNDSRR